MNRKQFKADLDDAIQGKHGVDDVSNCRRDDEGFTFTVTHQALASPVTISVTTAPSKYPDTHDYQYFCDDDTSQEVAHIVGSLGTLKGMSIKQFLSHIRDALCRSTGPDLDDETPEDHDPDDEPLESDDSNGDDDDDDEDIYGGAFDDPITSGATAFLLPTASARVSPSSLFQSRIRSDLKCVKLAGFKISHFGGLLDNYKCVVSISISARKLGISDEAMQAWRIGPSDYIILLIQYKEGYKTKEELCALSSAALPVYLDMRVGVSKNYKPTQDQVTKAFGATSTTISSDSASTNFHDTFISKPLNNLLNERLVHLVRLRDANMSWQGVEDFYRDRQGGRITSTYAPGKHFEKEKASGYPAVVDADHLADAPNKTHSFPLVAMQFTLRHFVRCTEFCLVCHKKLDTLVEALKPYVCDSPLCLYQYMTLGFGPSIEHEIMHQDKVVDLLISFCYSSAYLGRLKDFPTGLGLNIPQSIVSPIQGHMGRVYPVQVPETTPTPRSSTDGRLEARFDFTKSELLFDNVTPGTPRPLKTGDWISFELPNETGTPTFHCRVKDTSLYPSIEIGSIIGDVLEKEFNTAKWCTAYVEKYSVNFDDLSEAEKRGVVPRLLALLPSVKEMGEYLSSQNTPDLSRWVDRISPAAFSLLRWTLASNRSCIVAIDEPEKGVHGMPDFMQFRFAMGAPDKEHRFKKAVEETKTRLKSKYPTLYAWHGSPLQNWHSIIREGLHFSDILNGRAFGNGIYHAPNVNTSLSYSGFGMHHVGPISAPHLWPKSDLKITSAVALNEIVNAPAEFISSTPHYVISQLDWVQTRYLFVRRANTDSGVPKVSASDKQPVDKLQQDPQRMPTGISNEVIVIPAPSSSSNKRKLANVVSPGPKKAKKVKSLWNRITAGGSIGDVVDLTGDDNEGGVIESHYNNGDLSDNQSVATDDEDCDFFKEPQHQQLALRTGPSQLDYVPGQTDFVPGSLNHDQLPKLPMPSYANFVATKRLSQDLQTLLNVQKSKPLEELGWYFDSSKVDNMYQWIVELHSFEMFNEGSRVLPLVTDMKKHNVKSIVLELRFPGSYPNNPPFIRVIRPRFLPLLNGGGGNITAGGAICHQILVSDGWLPAYSIESILVQIRLAMAQFDPTDPAVKPARLQISGTYTDGDRNSYGSKEAIMAYERAARVHGWTIPTDFAQTVAEESAPKQE
ncbi:hypothetical protein E4T39_00594 [Aureobasidium subglaciale]|nr:hypothetical protein E4T39_00594 [Aureobasidium subglaciale]